MLMIDPAKARSIRSGIITLAVLFLLSACGLRLDNQARLERGQQAYVDGNCQAAAIDAKSVLRDEPDNSVAVNNLAWAYFPQGDPRAEDLARRAYDVSPENGSVVNTLGWILVKKGFSKDGVKILRKADELSNGRAAVRYHLAAGLVASGEAEEARSLRQEILTGEEQFSGRQETGTLLTTL